jgi:DNA polymerase-3 subunit delta'
MKPLAKLIGQSTAVELLERAIAIKKIAPAYLLVGTDGIGKSLAAKCFAEMLFINPDEDYLTAKNRLEKGNHPDFFRVSPTYLHQGKLLTVKQAEEIGIKRKTPPQIRIEQIREISRFLMSPPLKSERAIVVVENAETMAESAGNALLKTLEEPGKATIILIAPSIDSLLPTLVSRCQCIPFYRLSDGDLKLVLQREGYEEILEYPELLKIAQGSPGKAISSFKIFQELPSDLISKVKKIPRTAIDSFALAKEISKNLELETMIWLIDYLQYLYWEKIQEQKVIDILEKSKKALLNYVQPRLVWECLFLSLVSPQHPTPYFQTVSTEDLSLTEQY